MKRFYVIMAIAIVTFSVVFMLENKEDYNNLIIKNVEALAKQEVDAPPVCYMHSSYGVKVNAVFCHASTTHNTAYPCTPPSLGSWIDKRSCY